MDKYVRDHPSEEVTKAVARKTNLTFNTNPKEFINTNLTVDNGKVMANSRIQRGTLLYKGEYMLHYHKLTAEEMPVLSSLLVLSDERVEEILALLANLYPRTREESKMYFMLKFPGLEVEIIEQMLDSTRNLIDAKIAVNQFEAGNHLSINDCCVYGVGSMFNHNCNSNCINIANNSDFALRIVAICDIEQGEECTISYNHNIIGVNNRMTRRRVILASKGFVCDCTYCFNDLPVYSTKQWVEMLTLPNINPCAYCGVISYLSKCSRCKKFLYCGTDCQVKHWSEHKLVCK